MIPHDPDTQLLYARTLLHDMGVEADGMGDDEVRACMRPTVVAAEAVARHQGVVWFGDGLEFIAPAANRFAILGGRAIRDIRAGERVACAIGPIGWLFFGVDFVQPQGANTPMIPKPHDRPEWVYQPGPREFIPDTPARTVDTIAAMVKAKRGHRDHTFENYAFDRGQL